MLERFVQVDGSLRKSENTEPIHAPEFESQAVLVMGD
jgi:hypothetical protein